MSEIRTPSQFVAHMVVEFSFRAVSNTLQNASAPSPIEGVILTPEQRAQFNLQDDGQAFLFPMNETGVFLDISGHRMRWWFDDPSAFGAQDELEAAILKQLPNFRRLADDVRPDTKMRRRVLEGDLNPYHLAQVEISYPERGVSDSSLFVAQVYALKWASGEGNQVVPATLPPWVDNNPFNLKA